MPTRRPLGKDKEAEPTIPELPLPWSAPCRCRSIAACRPSIDTLGYPFSSFPLTAQAHTLSLVDPALIANPQCPSGIKSRQAPSVNFNQCFQLTAEWFTALSLSTLMNHPRQFSAEVEEVEIPHIICPSLATRKSWTHLPPGRWRKLGNRRLRHSESPSQLLRLLNISRWDVTRSPQELGSPVRDEQSIHRGRLT